MTETPSIPLYRAVSFGAGESGKHATVASQRNASNVDYLSYVDSGPSQFFEGEVVEGKRPNW